MKLLRLLLDRTAVLFLGVAAGAAIGYAFGTGNESKRAVVLAPEAAPVVVPRQVAPPAPGAAASPEAKAPAGATAEPVEQPAETDQPSAQIVDTVRNQGTIRVGVFGDSFGDGVWTALYRLLPAKAGYEVDKFSQQSTGFTRYRSLNLEQHDDSQIGDAPLDVAVIAFGANDAQGVCDGGHCGTLMGPFWQKVIAARASSYVAMLRKHGATVYWVGLPVMRDAAYDADAVAMDAFYRQTMAQLGVPFIDIRPLTSDGQGHYQAYYSDSDGTPRLLRADDGVHMSMNGYIRVTKALAARIRDSVESARRADAPVGFENGADSNGSGL